jgi:hypothetical protein
MSSGLLENSNHMNKKRKRKREQKKEQQDTERRMKRSLEEKRKAHTRMSIYASIYIYVDHTCKERKNPIDKIVEKSIGKFQLEKGKIPT